ncbi:hypothetical protein EJB05_49978, partial [Eragrostis curvula]
MAANNESSVVGPVAFKDAGESVPVLEVKDVTVPTDPRNANLGLHCYQGTCVLEQWVPGIMAIQQSFTPRRGDVILASAPKCGTTWLKALTFATMARGVHPPTDAEHPLLRLNPHDCVPFMEILFAAGLGSKMDDMPSPRLMATHMPHSLLPDSITRNPDCKIIYICRDPKDMVVSMWHYGRRIQPDASVSDVLELTCKGMSPSGPIWDHVLGYWNDSKTSPEMVLFLRYEEMLCDPVENARKIAQFVGQPFSKAQEETGMIMDTVRLCSFHKLKNLDVNKTGSQSPFANDGYFRKGEAGDWANHMTPEMARRLDAIVEEKLRGSGFSFA